MGTTIRTEISKKNQYWMSKYRYLELKNFCRQYSEWKHNYISIDGFGKKSSLLAEFSKDMTPADITQICAFEKEYYKSKIEMIETVCKETSDELCNYILLGVTNGYSYDVLRIKFNIPCCKDTYYNLYRKFFWLLDKTRE